MVRPGIAFYGHYPDPSCEGLDGPGLEPLMTLKTRVASVKTQPAGTAVSYGRTHTLDRETRFAVLNVGYGDGLPRACSDRLKVWVGGGYASVVGRICMDQTIVDVSKIPDVKSGDVAVVIGKSGDEEITAGDLAEWAGTISNEILSRMGAVSYTHLTLPTIEP